MKEKIKVLFEKLTSRLKIKKQDLLKVLAGILLLLSLSVLGLVISRNETATNYLLSLVNGISKEKSYAVLDPSGGSLSGTVVEEETGLPIAGAKLELRLPVSITGRTRYEPIQLTSDSSGKFTKSDLQAADGYDLKLISLPNQTIQPKSTKINIQSNKETTVEIKADKDGQISFNISQPSPSSGVKVSGKLYTREGEPISQQEIRIGNTIKTTTKDDGSFSVSGFGRGIYPISVINNRSDDLYYFKLDYHNEIPSLYITGENSQEKAIFLAWKKINLFEIATRAADEKSEYKRTINLIDINNNKLAGAKMECSYSEDNWSPGQTYVVDGEGKIILGIEEFKKCKNFTFYSGADLNNPGKLIKLHDYQLSTFRSGEEVKDIGGPWLVKTNEIYTIPLPAETSSLLVIYADLDLDWTPDIEIDYNREFQITVDDQKVIPLIDQDISMGKKMYLELSPGDHRIGIIANGYRSKLETVKLSVSELSVIYFHLQQDLICEHISETETDLCFSSSLNLTQFSVFKNNLIKVLKKIQTNFGFGFFQDVIIIDSITNNAAIREINNNTYDIYITSSFIKNTSLLNNYNSVEHLILHEYGHVFDLKGFNSKSNQNLKNKFFKIFNVENQDQFYNLGPENILNLKNSPNFFLKLIAESELIKFAGFEQSFAEIGHPWDNINELFATDFHNYFAFNDVLINRINSFGEKTENYNYGVFDYKFIRYLVDFAFDNDYDFPVANSKDNQDPFPCGNIFENGKVWTAEQILNGDFLKCEEQKSPTASLQGKVYDANGNVVSVTGAKVEIPSKSMSGVTYQYPDPDREIKYVISGIPLKQGSSGETVQAIASYDKDPSCPKQTVNVDLKSGQTTTQNFQLNCRPKPVTQPSANQISGTVTNSTTNQPLANAEITIDLPAPIPDLHAVTDSNGHYSIVVPDAVQSATNITVTANHSSSSSPRLRTVTYGGSSLQTDFQLIPKTTRANENTSPNITKLIYQKTVSKNKTILNFNYQAEDKEDKSSKLKYSYRINNGKWSKWTKKTKVKYDITKYQEKTVQFELKVRDAKNKEGKEQKIEINI